MSVVSRIGSRHTGQITEQFSSEHKGRLPSNEQESRFSEFEGTFSFSELDIKFFFKPFFLIIDWEAQTGMVIIEFAKLVVQSSN